MGETFEVLRTLGHSESEARRLLDATLGGKKKYKDVQELLHAIYEGGGVATKGAPLMPSAIEPSVVSTDDDASPRGSPCPKCGSLVEPGEKFCHACAAAQVVAPAAPTVVQRRFHCKTCGAEVLVDPGQRSFSCPFCDSTYVLELPAGESNRQPPEFVIGFALTMQQAAAKYDAWLRKGGWFCPGDLSQAQICDKLRGVYLPFWSFSMLAESRWQAQIGEYWYRTETYTVVENGKTVTRTRRGPRNRMVESRWAASQLLQRLPRIGQQRIAASRGRAHQAVPTARHETL